MGILGVGIVIGGIVGLGHLLAAVLPYAVLASALTDKEDKKD